MRKFISILVMIVILAWSNITSAAGFNVDVNISKQNDGTTCTEFRYDGHTVWRIELLADGAQPVASLKSTDTISIMPDIINGLLVIKIYRW